MLNFLYFLPQVMRQDATREKLVTCGLGDVLRDRLTNDDLANKGRLAFADVVHGPGGHAGTIVYPLPTAPSENETDGLGYYPARQSWRCVEVADTPGYYIGWDPNNVPTPEALERESIVSGYLEELGDEQLWELPIIRMQHGETNLPDTWGLENGKVVLRVKRKWRWAWDLTEDIWQQLISGEDPEREKAFAWCAKLLSINYRVGPTELEILGALGSKEATKILRASINGPLIERLRDEQKKTSSPAIGDTSDCSPGSKDSTPNSPPAEVTSTSPPSV